MQTTMTDTCLQLVRTHATVLKENASAQSPADDLVVMKDRFAKANNPVEIQLRTALATHFPHIQWSDAEFDVARQHTAIAPAYWVCDMLDGGVHYVQGFSPWTTTLTLVENGQATFSIVYDVMRDEMFHAVRGGGAFLNGSPIQVSHKSNMAAALVGVGYPGIMSAGKTETAQFVNAIERLSGNAFGVRMLGPSSLQLAYVACGRFDAFCEFGDDIYDWLAGALLVQEAGGVLTAAGGEAFSLSTKDIAAAGPGLHVSLLECMG